MSNYYLYIVEGETEKKIINSIKNKYIKSGKVIIKNLLQNYLNETFLRTISKNTNIIIVFDTDVVDDSMLKKLEKNIEKLKSKKNVKNIYTIPQVNNLEDELVFSTSIRNIKDLLNSSTNKEFKSDFLKKSEVNIISFLEQSNFSVEKFWSRKSDNIYSVIENNSIKIKTNH